MKWLSDLFDHPLFLFLVWPIIFAAYGSGIDVRWEKSQRAEAVSLSAVAVGAYMSTWSLFQDGYWGMLGLIVVAYVALTVLAFRLYWRSIERR